MAPAMIHLTLHVFSEAHEASEYVLIRIPFGLIGLINTLVFFYQQRSSQKLQASAEVLEEINNSLSLMEESIDTDENKIYY